MKITHITDVISAAYFNDNPNTLSFTPVDNRETYLLLNKSAGCTMYMVNPDSEVRFQNKFPQTRNARRGAYETPFNFSTTDAVLLVQENSDGSFKHFLVKKVG